MSNLWRDIFSAFLKAYWITRYCVPGAWSRSIDTPSLVEPNWKTHKTKRKPKFLDGSRSSSNKVRIAGFNLHRTPTEMPKSTHKSVPWHARNLVKFNLQRNSATNGRKGVIAKVSLSGKTRARHRLTALTQRSLPFSSTASFEKACEYIEWLSYWSHQVPRMSLHQRNIRRNV